MGSWSPFGAYAGTLLGSAAGAIVNVTVSRRGPGVRLAHPLHRRTRRRARGLAIRRHFVERVPHQPPAKSPLGEAFRVHWRTILHLVALTAGLGVGLLHHLRVPATWLAQVAGVPARKAFEINTSRWRCRSPSFCRGADERPDRPAARCCSVGAALLMVLALPLMALMTRGQTAAILVGQVVLALLVRRSGGALPATMAELAPWRVRCTVLSIAYNLGMALLGGTTPLVAAWLVAGPGGARSGRVLGRGGGVDLRRRDPAARDRARTA